MRKNNEINYLYIIIYKGNNSTEKFYAYDYIWAIYSYFSNFTFYKRTKMLQLFFIYIYLLLFYIYLLFIIMLYLFFIFSRHYLVCI